VQFSNRLVRPTKKKWIQNATENAQVGGFAPNEWTRVGYSPEVHLKQMTKKLFVGGLSWGTTDEQLKAAFEAFGATEAKVILDQETGRSRGFGFVTCSDDDAAKRALGELDGSELDGRTIRVNAAEEKPRPQRSGGGDSRSGGGGGSRSSGGGGSRSSGGGGSRSSGGGGSRSGGYSGGGGRPRQPSAPSRRSGGGGDRGGRRDGDDKFARRRSSAQKSRGGRDSSYSDSDGDYDIDQDY